MTYSLSTPDRSHPAHLSQSSQEDIKPDISPVRNAGRGRGRGECKEIEMTATGPMAQGPAGNRAFSFPLLSPTFGLPNNRPF